MAMKWNSRNDRFEPNGGNGRESFKAHDERMREFRRSHADVAMVNAPRLDKAVLLERMKPLQVIRTRVETGGSRIVNGATDWSALVPALKVARYKFSQN